MQEELIDEVEYHGHPTSNPLLKWPASLISYIFHPIFVPLYVSFFIVYLHPYYFSGFSAQNRMRTMLIVFQNAVFYPLFATALLKWVGFIPSYFLRTQKERIIPYIASSIFFFWLFLIFKQQPDYPRMIAAFFLGVFLASSAALIANIYFKISMHGIGMGGWLGAFLVIAGTSSVLMTWPLAIVVLFTGLVATARLLVSDHRPADIYAGIALGLACQFIAAYAML